MHAIISKSQKLIYRIDNIYVISIYMYVISDEALIWEKIKLYSTILFYIDILLYYKYYYLTIVYMYNIMYCIKGYNCAGFIFAVFNHFLNQEFSRTIWRH